MATVRDYLTDKFDEIDCHDFYRFIFPKGSLQPEGFYLEGVYNAIAVQVPFSKKEEGKGKKGKKKKEQAKNFVVTDDLKVLDELAKQDDCFVYVSPAAYAGRNRLNENARLLFGFAIDVDYIEDGEPYPLGMELFEKQWFRSHYLPIPNLLVSSGSGMHVYYVFANPIKLFESTMAELKKLKDRLTWQYWTQGAINLKACKEKIQYEALCQSFRVPGSLTKDGKTRAKGFLVKEEKYKIEELNTYVPEKFRAVNLSYKNKFSLAEAEALFPEWFQRRIVEGRPRETFTFNRAVYDSWLKRLENEAVDGHRYWELFTLAVLAKKCAVPFEEVKKDAYSLIKHMDEIGRRDDNPFTEDDVDAALEGYNDAMMRLTSKTAHLLSGMTVPETSARRHLNHRSQDEHLKINRFIVHERYGENWRNKNGAPLKKDEVLRFRAANPDAKKADCVRETGLDKKTVSKYWDCPLSEITTTEEKPKKEKRGLNPSTRRDILAIIDHRRLYPDATVDSCAEALQVARTTVKAYWTADGFNDDGTVHRRKRVYHPPQAINEEEESQLETIDGVDGGQRVITFHDYDDEPDEIELTAEERQALMKLLEEMRKNKG